MRTYTKQELIDLCANACEGNLEAQKEYRLLIQDAKNRGDMNKYCYLRYIAKEISDCYINTN